MRNERPSLSRRIADLERSQGELRRRVSHLANVLRVSDNAPALLTSWIGKEVYLAFSLDPNDLVVGTLQWSDRYHIGLEIDGNTVIYSKGRVQCIGRPKKEK